MGFSYFRGIVISSGLKILTPYQIDVVIPLISLINRNILAMGFSNGKIIFVLYKFFVYKLIMILENTDNIQILFDISFSTHPRSII